MSPGGEALFRNARFVDPSVCGREAGEAILARDGRIAFVGAEALATAQARPSARRVDLGGRTVLPGLVDAHVHLESLGASLGRCDLSGTRDRGEAVERLAAWVRAHRDQAWVRGRGYNLNAWADPSYPTARQLDEGVRDRPCVAVSFDGHSAWVNTAALTAAGVGAGTPDPPGGVILRDARGRPAGCLLEAAVDLIHRAIQPEDDRALDEHWRLAIQEMSRRGHTAVHAPIGSDVQATLDRIGRLYPGDTCPLRVRLFPPFDALEAVAGLARRTPAASRVRPAGVKCFLDGSLGSRTAWLFEPFAGDQANRGVQALDVAELRRRIGKANATGLPLICHAIGDRACAEALAAFADAGDPAAGNRIEHAQILRPGDLDLFARAGVAASVQPGHIRTDWQPSDRLLGAGRARWSYPLRSLLDHGVVLAMGSDSPVVPPDLQASLHAAVTRTDAAGRPPGGWHGEERITPREWAAAASRGAWRSIGESGLLGGLEPGMMCDLAVLSDDILAPGAGGLTDWAVDATVVGGEIAFRHWAAPSRP